MGSGGDGRRWGVITKAPGEQDQEPFFVNLFLMKHDSALIRLSRDHQRGLALAQRLEREVPTADSDQLERLRLDTIDFWRNGLLPHFRAECECLLARLVRHAVPRDDLISRTEHDHLLVHSLLAALRDAGRSDSARGTLQELGNLLREHIRWEESVLFEVAQTALDATELAVLGLELADRLPEVPPRPSWYPAT